MACSFCDEGCVRDEGASKLTLEQICARIQYFYTMLKETKRCSADYEKAGTDPSGEFCLLADTYEDLFSSIVYFD